MTASDPAARHRHGLPVLRGAEHLGFRCNGCGACCKSLRVALTHLDLQRLTRALVRSGESLVEWLPPSAVELDAERDCFVELADGPRLMVLAQSAGACQLLTAAQRCSAYEARPYDCRLYPFLLERDASGAVVQIRLFELEGCGEERGSNTELESLAEQDRARWVEHELYRELVARWNRLARQRRRFRHRVGGAADFLAFAEEATRKAASRR
jgi:Fe-S-cluster containining protein